MEVEAEAHDAAGGRDADGFASLMNLPADLLLSLMEKEAAVNGTMSVLRGLASARRRFQELAYGESSTLFTEPVFVSGRQGSRLGAHPILSSAWSAGDTILDVARLSSRFGERIERLHLGNVSFDFGFGLGAARSSSPWILDLRVAEMAAAFGRDSIPAPSELEAMQTRVSRCLLEVLRACPNLTHLSLAGADPKGAFRSLAALSDLPASFYLHHLRHLDLSGLTVPLPALHRLLRACSISLERLFLRGTRPPALLLNRSLDLSSTGVSAVELQPLLSRFPELKDLYVLGMVQNGVLADEALLENQPGCRLIRTSLIDMDTASLRELRAHFDGTAYPRPEEARVDVPRFATAFLFKALCDGSVARADELVSGLGISPLDPLDEAGPWVPAYFRDAAATLPEWLREGGSTALHYLLAGNSDADDVERLISEWKLEPLVNLAQRSGRRRTPLHIAVERTKPSTPAIINILLKLGADPLRPDAAGATALHIAFRLADVHLATELLREVARAKLDLLSANGGAARDLLQTLLGDPRLGPASAGTYSRSRIALHAVEILGLEGPDLQALGVRRAFFEETRWGKKGNEILLHFAARENLPSAVRALLNAGADAELKEPQEPGRDREGRSFLGRPRGSPATGATVLEIALGMQSRGAALVKAIIASAESRAVRAFAEANRVPLDRGEEAAARPEKRARTSDASASTSAAAADDG
eukprot:tig00020675_g12638.t1